MKKAGVLVLSIFFGVLVGSSINLITSQELEAKIDNQGNNYMLMSCGTCRTFRYSPGTFCDWVYPGGGCGRNTGAPCGPNCGIDIE